MFRTRLGGASIAPANARNRSSFRATAVNASMASHLQQLWSRISGNNNVPRGGTRYWPLSWEDNPGTKAFTTSLFYGCTIVLIANGKHAVIGHYDQQKGRGDVMDHLDEVNKYIIDGLLEQLLLWDPDDACHAWIIHSSGKSVGYRRIAQFLKDNGIAPGNINNCPYNASTSVVDFEDPRGKAVLQWEQNATGVILSVFIQQDHPVATFSYSRTGEPL